MRTLAVAALGLVSWSVSFAQGSLCNPCVDPPLEPGISVPQRTLTVDPAFNLGAAVSNLRSIDLVDAGLFSAAQRVMPEDLSSSEIRLALSGARWISEGTSSGEIQQAGSDALWREDRQALAVTLQRANATLAFVFVRQADGSYAGTDATAVISRSAFGFFGWPAAEYERYEIKLLSWAMQDSNPALLRAEVRAWRQGQRHTTSGSFAVSADGSITNP